jgi:putative heme-binding domain-containing protein
VLHPVALDWSTQGHLWVAEIVPESDSTPTSGRVVRLEDTDTDGVFERREVFLSGLPPASSVMDWPPGVLIAAAPDLLYAEDGNNDGVADSVRRLFVGFGAQSVKRRFNSLNLGLDGWVYAANGLGGGWVQPFEIGGSISPAGSELISLEETDFRFSLDQRSLEPVEGLSWIGRARDEFGHWLGLDADLGLVHFPLPRYYTLRNTAVAFPDPVVAVLDGEGKPLQLGEEVGVDQMGLHRLEHPPGGADIHRARTLGPVRRGDLLVTIPWKQRVLHVPLRRRGLGLEPNGEPDVLLSVAAQARGNGFTPTQVRSGPDDAIWITDSRVSAVPASPSAGRILRLESLYGAQPRLEDRLALLKADPVQALLSPNAALRDLAHRWIVAGKASVDESSLRSLGLGPSTSARDRLGDSEIAAVRVQALSILRQLQLLRFRDLEEALTDPEPAVRAHALRLCESHLRRGLWPNVMANLIQDADPIVRFQTALSLGEATHPTVADLWTKMALTSGQDQWMRAALLSSAAMQPLPLLNRWLEANAGAPSSIGKEDLTRNLIRTARLRHTHESIAKTLSESVSAVALAGVAELIASEPVPARRDSDETEWLSVLGPCVARARTAIETGRCAESSLPLHLSVLGAQPKHATNDWRTLLNYARWGTTSVVRETALYTLLRCSDVAVARLLLEDWPQWRPSLRPTIVGALTARTPWTAQLLQALERGELVASELSPAQQGQLLHHPDPDVRSEAAALLTALLQPPRAEAIALYRAALAMKGNAAMGAETFGARCAACHAPPPPLQPTGPNLATIGSRTLPELALAILDPNALVEPDYRAFFIETKEGESATGILRRETEEALELLLVGGTRLRLPLDRAEEIRASNVSLMPEGLEAGLAPQDFADLLAFLKSLQ